MAFIFLAIKTQIYILLSLKTPAGFDYYGQYFLGDDSQSANALFDSLSGSCELRDNALLHIDLMETIYELPVKVQTKCCTLEELCGNIKLITRDVFRNKNLKPYEE